MLTVAAAMRWRPAARWWSSYVGNGAREGVPDAEPTSGLVTKILADELLLRAFSGTSGFWAHPTRVDRRVRDEVSRGLEFYSDKGWIDDPASYHRVPEPLVAPDLAPTWSFPRCEHMSFESGYEPMEGEPGRRRWVGYRDNRTAHAWVMRHADPSRPWIVAIHGYGMGRPAADLGAIHASYLHRKLGLNVLGYVMPLHGPRRVGSGYGSELFTGGVANLIHGEAQAMWDLRRIISWIRSQGATRIAAHGLSLGGYTTALLATLEPELSCAIAGIPASDFVDLFRRHVPAEESAESRSVERFWEDTRRLLRVVSPLALPARIPRSRRYVFAAVADRLAPPGAAHALWEHWERPQIEWYQGTHVSFIIEPGVRAFVDTALADSGMTEHRSERGWLPGFISSRA